MYSGGSADLKEMASATRSDYTEISKCVPGVGVNLGLGDVDSLYSGCGCSGQCEFGAECGCRCAYSQDGHVFASYLEQTSAPIMECNSSCSCGSNCRNRTTQREPSVKMALICTDNKGVGVVTEVKLQQGAFIGEYVGEVITTSMVKDRLRTLGSDAKCYILQYREHLSDGILSTNIDATSKGNVTRFINHSCEPNLTVIPVRSDSVVPRLCLFTCKDVAAGEELCFSYFGMRGSQHVPLGNKRCFCGSSSCVGYLPYDHALTEPHYK